jgi:hypothetical protein
MFYLRFNVFVCELWCLTHIVLCSFVFFCHGLVSCVPNIVSFSGLSILDCLFVFPNVYFRSSISLYVLLLSFIYTYLPPCSLKHDISVW